MNEIAQNIDDINFHRFCLGKAELLTIFNRSHIKEPINPSFLMDKSESEILKIAHQNSLQKTNWRIATPQC